MRLVVNLGQMLEIQVGIDLSGGKALMSQEFLHGSHIRSIVEHVSCEGMPKLVRCQVIREFG